MSEPNFYSYIWLRIDNTPYYAGKGCRKRAFSRHNGVYPPPRHRIIIFPMESEVLAFESEKALIELFGRKDNNTGILRNLTDGGEGQSGLHEEGRKKISLALKGRIISPEWRNKLSRTLKARAIRPSIEACRNGGKTSCTPEHRRKLSEAAKHRPPISEETRQKLRALLGDRKIHLGHKHSEETRRKMSETKKRNRRIV